MRSITIWLTILMLMLVICLVPVTAEGFILSEAPQVIAMAIPIALVDETPDLIIKQLMPTEYPEWGPNNGFVVDVYDVSSATKKCPPGAVLSLSYANGDVEAFGVANLRIMRYDPDSESWVSLPTTLDTENCSVSAPIKYLGVYTISHETVEDTEAPTVSWLIPDENAELSAPTTIEVEASDNVGVARVEFYIDDVMIGDDTTNLDGEWSVSLDCSRIATGTHTLKAIVNDLAENAGIATRNITVKSNAIAPSTTIRSIILDMEMQYIVVTGTATDRDGQVVNVMLKLDGEPVRLVDHYGEQWTMEFHASLLKPGTHTFTAVAVDNDFNTGSSSVAVNIPLSMVFLSASPELPQQVNTPITLTALAVGGKTVEYHFLASDGKAWNTIQAFGVNSTCIWTPTVAGEYTVKVLAREQGTTAEFDFEWDYTISSALTTVSLTADLASPCTANSIVSLTAVPTGGANLEYEFQLDDGKGWKVIQDYDQNDVCSWEPAKTGNYTLKVSAREQGSEQKLTSTALSYSVTAPPTLKAVTLAMSPRSPQPRYSVVTLTATPNGGGNVEYKFQINDGKEWKLLRNFDRYNIYEWEIETVGTFTLRVVAREIGTALTVTDDEILTITTKKALTGVDLQIDPVSPQPATADILLRAVRTNGIQAEFQFLEYNGKAWTTLQEYSVDNEYVWTPLTPGTYTLKVTAREEDATQEFFDKVTYTITAPPNITEVKLTTDPASPQLPRTSITLSAIPVGGANVEYQFLVYDGENWTTLGDFAGAATNNWTPTKVGVYTLKVNAREAGATETVSYERVYTIGVPLVLSDVILSTDINSPQPVKTEVVLSASTTGGGVVEYTFLVDNGDGWTTLRGYSTVATATWTPKTAGSYSLKVLAREVGTTREYAHQYTYNIQPTLTAVALGISPASPQQANKTITLTGTPTGGSRLMYQFEANDGTGWNVIQEYSSANTCEWIPEIVGNYTLKVTVSEMEIELAYSAQAKFTATKPLALTGVSLTTELASPQPHFTPITLRPIPTNGIDVEYQFEVFDGTTWEILNTYDGYPTCSWFPNEGSYTLKVTARESEGKQKFTATLPYTITLPPLTAVTLEATGPSPQLRANGVTFFVTPTGGTKVEYRFQVFDGQTWTTFRDYATGNIAAWTPKTANTYDFKVIAREVGTTLEVESAVMPYVFASSLSAVSLAVSLASPQAVNTPITLTATPTGGANVEYQFLVDDGGGWIELGKYSASSNCKWTPTVADTYLLKVVARERGTNEKYWDEENYKVTP